MGVTNYKTLLDQIERANKKNEPVCLVTFNYDTLLENALSDFGLPIEAFTDYTKKRKGSWWQVPKHIKGGGT